MIINRLNGAALALVALSALLALTVGPSLPDPVPTHWNVAGEIDGWTPKPWGVWLFPLVTGGLWLMFLVLPFISPRGFRLDTARRPYDIIWLVMVLRAVVGQSFMTFMPVLLVSRGYSLVSGGVMITRDQIERSRAANAFEALERARTHLVIQWTRQGTPPSITYRGRNSLVQDGDVLVVVDGTPTMEAARVLSQSGLDFDATLVFEALSMSCASVAAGSASVSASDSASERMGRSSDGVVRPS